ncbi:citrate synthase, mitochondrial-like, partial [Octopus sinensis]|uniref:Citrate synthase n=1 Tax=Octopus sinensis TaxID=2607531 RepID=A0A6P7TTB6_9MOLL
VYGGMKGILGLVCETSVLDANEGIRFRGFTITEVMKLLPKGPNGAQVQPEGIFWLLATGKIPSRSQVDSFELVDKCEVPDFIPAMLTAMPSSVHPMAQFSAAMTALSQQSQFAEAYIRGIPKSEHWKDVISVVAKAPTVAAMVYRNLYRGGSPVKMNKNGDWTANFAEMLGYGDSFTDMLRLYLTLHWYIRKVIFSDHEGGNVSAHTCHLVGSALSDPFLCFGAALNGLAGPLHGMACQEVLSYLTKLREEMGSDKMTDDQLEKFIRSTLARGQVIPGYGHAVLRKTDPRFTAFQEFAQANIKEDPLVDLVAQLYRVVPRVLGELGKVQNPFPNVDSHSGCLLQHFGMTEIYYYTVLFGVSRALGVMSQLIWSRALGFPIERPKSISSKNFIAMFSK